jgi:hypothetical protein
MSILLAAIESDWPLWLALGTLQAALLAFVWRLDRVIKWINRGAKRRLPEGCTDDLSIQLSEGHTLDELVDAIMSADSEDQSHEALVNAIATQFGLTEHDAELAIDRVGGGMFRAMLHPNNAPDRIKDPIAWVACEKVKARSAGDSVSQGTQ